MEDNEIYFQVSDGGISNIEPTIWDDYKQLVRELKSSEIHPVQCDLLHSVIGCATESGELLDAVKKSLFYGKSLDLINLKEEYGDLLWYIQLGLDTLGLTFEEVIQTNMAKLRKRYGEKFTQEKAENRDLKAERDILENKDA